MIEVKIKSVKVENSFPPRLVVYMAQNDSLTEFSSLNDKELTDTFLTVKRKKNKSLNANSYMWVLCGKIANAINKGGGTLTKEDVYREAISHVGKCLDIPIESGYEDEFEKTWCYDHERKKVGWFIEILEKRERYTYIRAYIGSSEYSSEELGKVIDYLVREAQEFGVDTATPDDINHLLSLWGNNGS